MKFLVALLISLSSLAYAQEPTVWELEARLDAIKAKRSMYRQQIMTHTLGIELSKMKDKELAQQEAVLKKQLGDKGKQTDDD